jgi:hypothetical protein
MKKHLCEGLCFNYCTNRLFIVIFTYVFFYTCFVYVHSIERLCKYNCNNLMTFRIYLMRDYIVLKVVGNNCI